MDKQELAPPESSSSSNYYFTQQALRAGYLKPGDLDSASRRDLREAILKEIEKERIREEIIAAQIAELRRRRTRSDVSFPNIPSSLTATVTEERAGEMSVEERLGRMVAIKHGIPLFETPTFHGPRF